MSAGRMGSSLSVRQVLTIRRVSTGAPDGGRWFSEGVRLLLKGCRPVDFLPQILAIKHDWEGQLLKWPFKDARKLYVRRMHCLECAYRFGEEVHVPTKLHLIHSLILSYSSKATLLRAATTAY